jgi:hypothetical protein
VGKWKKRRIRHQKRRIQKVIQIMKKTYCTHINLNPRATVCDGILLSAEDRDIKVQHLQNLHVLSE